MLTKALIDKSLNPDKFISDTIERERAFYFYGGFLFGVISIIVSLIMVK